MLDQPKSKRLATYAWIIVGYTVFVILWGAFVRATGSGAGCGSHWPTCNGEVIPRAESVETMIEFFHRVTSGIMGPMVIALIWWSVRVYGWSHRVTKGAIWLTIMIIIESLLGAGLVKFELVADNPSTERAYVMGAHLINTMILLMAATLTAWWAQGGRAFRFRNRPVPGTLLAVALFGLLIVSAFGAITALGDTLFPVESFAEGAAAKFDPSAHFAVKARLWHPTMAVGVSVYIVIMMLSLPIFSSNGTITRWRNINLALIGIQIAAGVINVLLAVPVWMQIVHLLLADLSWISMVIFTALVLDTQTAPEAIEDADPKWAISAGD